MKHRELWEMDRGQYKCAVTCQTLPQTFREKIFLLYSFPTIPLNDRTDLVLVPYSPACILQVDCSDLGRTTGYQRNEVLRGFIQSLQV